MFNLLLPSDKVTLYREYMLRVMIVAMGAFLTVIGIGIVLLLPSYVWLRLSEQALFEKRATLLKDGSVNQELVATLADAKKTIATLNTKQQVSLRSLVEALVVSRGSGIKLSDIEFDASGEKIRLHLTGVSADRESLVAFSKSLSKDPMYTVVDVPISNFVKDRNIEFSLNIQGK